MSEQSAQEQLNAAMLYALKSGCFFPVPKPKRGATTEDLIKWGAMVNLHRAIRRFWLEGSEV